MAEAGWTRPKQSFKLKKNNSITGKAAPLRREVSNFRYLQCMPKNYANQIFDYIMESFEC